MDGRIRKLVLAALFAALNCMMTMVIQIPAPTGYVNLGDCAGLLGAWLLGPVWGGAAAAIGSVLADILSGWAAYAPATFVIKFAMAAVAALLLRGSRLGKKTAVPMLLSAAVAELLMTGGYFAYESFVLHYGSAAVASVPANLVQGAVSAAAAVAAATLMARGGLNRA